MGTYIIYCTPLIFACSHTKEKYAMPSLACATDTIAHFPQLYCDIHMNGVHS